MASSSSAAADVSITREQLTKYFHLPITDVAKELGICATMLKKICRKNGIPRWPHRKIKSLNKMIESLEASLPNDGSEAGECIRQEIIILKNKKSLIMRNPSILVQGNPNKRSIDGDDQQTPKKARAEMQTPVTTFNNPKASLHTSTTPNSFSINQLLTPPSTFTPLASPSLVGATDEKDYRAFTHPHLLSAIAFPPDPTRADSKHPMDGRAPYPSPLTSYLSPEEDPRHLDGVSAPLLHPPSTDPYYYHKAAAMAYQYHYPRQMLPPSYPPHVLSTPPHLARSPYYHPFGVPPPQLESPRQQLTITNEPHGEQAQQQQVEGQEAVGERAQAQQTQQPAQPTQLQMQQKQVQQRQQPAQPQPTSTEALPKMNTTDVYKYNRPPSPTSATTPAYPSGGDMSQFYFSQFPQQQQQRLHQ